MQSMFHVLRNRFVHDNGIPWWDRLSGPVADAVSRSRVLLHATGKARRFHLVHFRKKYVQQQLRLRAGECRQCGTCYNMLFTCPLLTNNGMCLAYGTCRPESCRVFPIDQRDIDEVRLCGGRCGYRFEGGGMDAGASLDGLVVRAQRAVDPGTTARGHIDPDGGVHRRSPGVPDGENHRKINTPIE